MAKMQYDDYQKLQDCLFTVNNFVQYLHKRSIKKMPSKRSFLPFEINDDQLYHLKKHVEVCKQIEKNAIERAKYPIKKLDIELAPVEFSEEDQQLTKHCIKGARVHIGGFIDMINNGIFPLSPVISVPKTYLIAKSELKTIFHAMLQCSKLDSKL